MCASQPHSLNLESIHSAFFWCQGEPTWCGWELIRRMYSRRLSVLGRARNLFSQVRSAWADAAVNPCSGGGAFSPMVCCCGEAIKASANRDTRMARRKFMGSPRKRDYTQIKTPTTEARRHGERQNL